MGALNGAVKVFIVERLACFDGPTEVAQAVKQVFAIDVKRQQVDAYNPHSINGSRMSKTLKEVFEATRAEFLKDTSRIAISHKSYRLRVMQRLLDQVEKNGNVIAAAHLLEQAAKEEGGLFTNRQKHEHTGKDGGPVEMKHTLTDAERASRIATLVERARQRKE